MSAPASPSGRAGTAALAATLAVSALLICAHSAWGDGLGSLTGRPVMACILTAAFFLAEQNLITFEFRRQSHSMTFAGVPLALGVLMLSLPALVLARVAGSVAAMVVQRTRGEKLAYNTSAFAFEAAVTSSICAVAVQDMTPVSIALFIACVAGIDQLMTALVLVVIRMHGMVMHRRDVTQVLSQSVALSAVATVFAVALHILLLHGVTGDSVAAVLVAVAVLGYRMYAGTVRRHHEVATVHDFVTSSGATSSMEDVAQESLGRIKDMIRASAVELTICDTDASDPSHSCTVFSVGEDGRLAVRRDSSPVSDWVRMRAMHSDVATLAIRGRDSALDAWLDGAGPEGSPLDDAIVVPMRIGPARLGAITVSGRLTDVVAFTHDDVRLLQTLSGHLAASIQNARLLETLSYDATHDALTGLANRIQLTNEIAALSDADAALLVIDIDHFKDVNDVLGHDVADDLLRLIASRLRDALPATYTLARIGGDEFAVLIRGDLGETELASTVESMVAQITHPVHLGAALNVSVSVGTATTSTSRAAELLRSAVVATHFAKTAPTHMAVYTPVMDVGRTERVRLAGDLRTGLDTATEQFAVYYQPKVDLKSGRAHGAEALVRWKHPAFGEIAPDRFIPIAETTGLIVPLTRHVLREALADCGRWRANGSSVDVAVNISARLLEDGNLITLVKESLAATGVPPSCLLLEITESVMMNDPDAALAALREVAELGVRMSLDDFGTGYSSLAYLQQLPVAELKIDRSFVAAADASCDSSTSLLLRNIVNLGRDLGMHLVAEGIETPSQAELLNSLGCTTGQGYYYARPMTASDFRSWLQHNRHDALRLLPSA